MAAKNDQSFSNYFSINDNSLPNESRYSNLNLNQNHIASNGVSSLVQSDSKLKFNKHSGGTVTDKYQHKSTTSNLQSKTPSKNAFVENQKEDKETEKCLKNDNSSKTDDSTLSLHIATYENSNEALNEDEIFSAKQFNEANTLESSTKLQNFFEFPRQIKDESGEPEIMQFKASQKLLNPNETIPANKKSGMAQLARNSPEEVLRREDYLREHQRPRELRDPFTWPWQYRAAGTAVGLCIGASHMHNLWLRKPWHYALYARLGLTVAGGVIAFSLGQLRVNNYQTREAVTEHYKELHTTDFDAVNDIYGRPFANVLLPWYPKRTQYRRFDS